jgi:Protein of unknown function (DUF2809)
VPPARSRWLLVPLMLGVVVLGLGSRHPAVPLPRFFSAYAGDALWTVMVYLCLLFLLPRVSVLRAAVAALGISFAVELSQLIHVPWLDALRAHRFGALLLGRGFLASDLLCYTVGTSLAAGLDLWLSGRRR